MLTSLSLRQGTSSVAPNHVQKWLRVRVRYMSKTTSNGNGKDQIILRHDYPKYGISVLTLNRPRQRNALSMELLNCLDTELNSLQASSKELRSVVLCANGPVFSAGHDLKEITSPENANKECYKKLFSFCSEVMQKVQNIPQPVIAAVDGIATAAGCQLVTTCDLVVASPGSKFATPGVDIGLFCSTPAVAVARAVNRKAAMDMLLTGRMVPAEEALSMGLISHIDEHPQQRAMELAKSIASRSAAAIAIGKKAFYQQIAADNLENAYECASRAMVEGMLTHDASEGINAFISKRTPEWKHD